MDNSINLETKNSTQITIGNGKLPIEVLQEIFHSLDFWNFLRCRAVCRLWQHSIPGNSPLMKKTLFLAPSFETNQAEFPFNSLDTSFALKRTHRTRNEHLDPPPVEVKILTISVDHCCLMKLRRSDFGHVFHPLMRDINRYLHLVNPSHSKGKRALFQLNRRTEGSNAALLNHMFVSQPPINEILLNCSHGAYESPTGTLEFNKLTRKRANGIRVIDVFEMLEEECLRLMA